MQRKLSVVCCGDTRCCVIYNDTVSWARWYNVERPEAINEPNINITDNAAQLIFVMYIERNTISPSRMTEFTQKHLKLILSNTSDISLQCHEQSDTIIK